MSVSGCCDEGENLDWEEGREWRLPCLLYVDVLVLCSDQEEELRVMVERFVDVSWRRDLKVNIGKSKVTVLGGD